MRKFYIILSLLLAVSVAFAQKPKNYDASELDYDQNLVIPAIPEKQAPAIRKHMNDIEYAIHNLSFKTERMRDKEIVKVVIPCSEAFAPNDTILKPAIKQKLQKFVNFLKYPTMYKMVVAVFTDNTGEQQYCDNLSSARANALDDYLISLAANNGIHNINVVPYGLGQLNPREENSTIAGRAANRRIEIYIIPEWQMIEKARSGKL